jgi:hypothetical protein
MNLHDYSLIRADILHSLQEYATTGRPVGDFLKAVLSNDLFDAVGRADDDNVRTIPQICSYVYNNMPSNCHGSREAYKEWIERFRP